VRLGNGDGTLAAEATYAVGNNPFSVKSADLTGRQSRSRRGECRRRQFVNPARQRRRHIRHAGDLRGGSGDQS